MLLVCDKFEKSLAKPVKENPKQDFYLPIR
jgi:hypothetical protein